MARFGHQAYSWLPLDWSSLFRSIEIFYSLIYSLLSSYFLKNLIEKPPCKRKWESIFLSDTFQPQGHASCLPVSGLLWRFKFDSVSSVDKKLVNSHLRKRWKILFANHNPGGSHSESSEKLPKKVRGGQYILDLDKGVCTIKHTSFFFFLIEGIALHCCVGFCHTSIWISHRYTYVPSLLNLPPSISYHSRLSQLNT